MYAGSWSPRAIATAFSIALVANAFAGTVPLVVDSHIKLSEAAGLPAGTIQSGAWFGSAIAILGDLNRPGDPPAPSAFAIAVGQLDEQVAGSSTGAVRILFLDPNGAVLPGSIKTLTAPADSAHKRFGDGLAYLGDIGTASAPAPTPRALAVGYPFHHGNGFRQGAVWILFLKSDGTIAASQIISDEAGTLANNFAGGFIAAGGSLDGDDNFGVAIAAMGDINGDGNHEIAVGANGDDDGGAESEGAVWIVSLNPNGAVSALKKISKLSGGGPTDLIEQEQFGHSLCYFGDLGVGAASPRALAVGSIYGSGTTTEHGTLRMLFLNPDGSSLGGPRITDGEGGFPTGLLHLDDRFSWDVAKLPDLDGDGTPECIVGAPNDDDAGNGAGALWLFHLHSTGTVKTDPKPRKITESSITVPQGCFTGDLNSVETFDSFGEAIAVADVQGDGGIDLFVGTQRDDDGGAAGSNRGAVWEISLRDIQDTYGGSCFGPAGSCLPTLSFDGCPISGGSAQFTVEHGETSTALLFISGAPSSIQLSPTCFLLAFPRPMLLSFGVSGPPCLGSGSTPVLPVPTSVSASAYFQAVLANASSFVGVTNGLRVKFN